MSSSEITEMRARPKHNDRKYLRTSDEPVGGCDEQQKWHDRLRECDPLAEALRATGVEERTDTRPSTTSPATLPRPLGISMLRSCIGDL